MPSKNYHAPARVLMAVIFIVSATGKLTNPDAMKQYMEQYGVTGYLLWPAAAFEMGSGTALLCGWHTRDLAGPLAAWCLLTAAIFHRDFKDQEQQINFMKNMAMAGGFLILAEHGAPHMSLRVEMTMHEPEKDILPAPPGPKYAMSQ